MVMVAAKSLPAGHFIKAEDLAWQSWPDQNTPPAYMVQGAVAPDVIVGSVVRNGIAQGEPITDVRIVKKGDRGFLAAVLAPGFRAITVQLQANAGLSGLVIPGDRVDLILTMTLPAAGKDAVERRVSETALQDIRVIAVDQRLDDQATDAPTAKTTTLEVTPKQAEIVTLLTDMGKLSMTLRSVGSAENDALAHEPSITWDNEATDLPFLKHRQTAATGNPGGNDAVSVMRGTAKSVVDFPTGIARDVDVGKGVILRLDRPAGNVFVADPNVADVQIKSPTVIYLLGKAAGTTTLFALDKQDQVLLNSPVEVHSDNLGLQRALQQLIPGTDVRARSVNDSIVLEGTVKSAAEGDDIRKIAARYVPNDKQLVNEMQLAAPNQINLHVRIAEVSRNVVKQFGIDWFTAANTGAAAFGLVTGGTAVAAASTNVTKIAPFLPGFNSGSTAPQFFNTQGSALIGSGSPGNLFGGVKVGSKSVDALVTALEDEGLVTMLAEPNLTAVSGQKASFLAGGEFPVPVPQSGTGGGAVVTIDYKQFGVSLSFLATVLSGNRISLHVAPEVSHIDP